MLRLGIAFFVCSLVVADLAVATAGQPAAGAASPREVRLVCGTQAITVVYGERTARVTVNGESVDLLQTVSASGARYEASNDPSMSLWSKGASATLVWKGKTHPECVPDKRASRPFSAGGNEPGWRLDISDTTLTLVSDYGARKVSATTPRPESVPNGRRYVVKTATHVVTATILDRICADTATGMPRPNTVEVIVDGRTLNGCGGEAVSLLVGSWQVTSIDGATPVTGSRVTMDFRDDERVAGNASCNNYTGAYALTAESLTFRSVAMTRKACAPDVMAQETAFGALLERVRRFEIDSAGRLILHASDGRRMTLSRQSN